MHHLLTAQMKGSWIDKKYIHLFPQSLSYSPPVTSP